MASLPILAVLRDIRTCPSTPWDPPDPSFAPWPCPAAAAAQLPLALQKKFRPLAPGASGLPGGLAAPADTPTLHALMRGARDERLRRAAFEACQRQPAANLAALDALVEVGPRLYSSCTGLGAPCSPVRLFAGKGAPWLPRLSCRPVRVCWRQCPPLAGAARLVRGLGTATIQTFRLTPQPGQPGCSVWPGLEPAACAVHCSAGRVSPRSRAGRAHRRRLGTRWRP